MQINKRCKQLIKEGLDNKTIRQMLFLEYDQEYDVAACRYRMKNKKPQPRLVFSDTHFPYQIDGYLEFLQDIHKKFNCHEQVIHLGDVWDHHSLSRHDSHPDAVGDVTEFDLAFHETQRLAKAFPKMIITLGNHDKIPQRQAATLGISERYMKSPKELWHTPDTWEIVDEIVIDNVLYTHGINNGGSAGAVNKAARESMSTCIGHYHSEGGVLFFANKQRMIFGANSGCLCDPTSLAMAYGKHSKKRPTIGCLVVHNNRRCEFIPMHLEKYGRDK